MKVQLKSIKVLKAMNNRGTGELLALIKTTKVVDDLDSVRAQAQRYFSTIFDGVVVTLDFKEIR